MGSPGSGAESLGVKYGTGRAYPLKQWAAVTTQRLVSSEPAQWWVPFFWMLTTQGHSASVLSSPPTIRFSRSGFPQVGGAGGEESRFVTSGAQTSRPAYAPCCYSCVGGPSPPFLCAPLTC